MQTGFIVVNEYRGRNMHGVNEHNALFDAAFPQAFLHLRGDVNERPAGGHLKPKFFAVAFHAYLSSIRLNVQWIAVNR
jgi:hypothetical protein